MGRLGLGFPAGRRRQIASTDKQPAVIQPGADWDGSAASGFAAVPNDPVRLTAKPGLQLLVPPRQCFTQSLTIGVMAMANNGGTMIDNLGLSHVRVHYEGAVQDIGAPTLYRFNDTNGVERTYWGWWITLEHNGTHGEAHIYFEAVPLDPTMQNRVIGPFSFFPAAQQYDFEVEVAPSQPVIPNQRYTNIRDAGNAIRAQNSQHGRILVTESGTYDLTPILATYVCEGYCTIEATVPITIAKSAYVPGSSAAENNSLLRLKMDGLWFKGGNITIDMAETGVIYHEGPNNPQNVFDGVTITDSKGRGALWLKGQKPTPYICRDNPYFLECEVSFVQNAFNNASLVRGCSYSGGAQDAFSYARCIAFNTLIGHHNEDWRSQIDAMTVRYSGPAASATIEMSGGSDTNNRIITLREEGVAIASFTAKNTPSDFIADTNYEIADVVAWINGLPGWTATLLDDTRRATALSHDSASTLGNAFGPVDCKATDATLHTVFDPHGDVWAINLQSSENSLAFGNLIHGNNLPGIFFSYNSHSDLFFVNNALATDEAINPAYQNLFSQWGKPGSHVVIAHNSLANQKLLLRTSSGMTADPYCLLANNCMLGIDWDGQPDAALTISSNHLHQGATSPAGSIAASIGGDQYDLFQDAATGDFSPSGDLLANKKPPVVKRDATGRPRKSNAPAGALA
ncbi:MAG: hypothetical protein EP341_07675 [Sphingomonadales bacterium]|nr:MAG: hypothetical protein EP341_07675 [Sphingomonadales bacterium]